MKAPTHFVANEFLKTVACGLNVWGRHYKLGIWEGVTCQGCLATQYTGHLSDREPLHLLCCVEAEVKRIEAWNDGYKSVPSLTPLQILSLANHLVRNRLQADIVRVEAEERLLAAAKALVHLAEEQHAKIAEEWGHSYDSPAEVVAMRAAIAAVEEKL